MTSDYNREEGKCTYFRVIALNSLKRPVTVQTHLTLEVFFATMRSFYNAKQCFFREKPELYGANTLAECVAHSKAYWNRRAQRYMYTPFEGACTVTTGQETG